MRKQHFVTILICLAFASTLSAQAWRGTGRLQGNVVGPDGKPVEGAKVTLISVKAGNSGPAPLTTDKKGNWAVLGLIGGQWKVDIEAPGYVAAAGSVELSEMTRIPPIKTRLERAEVVAEVPVETAPTGAPQAAIDAAKAGEELMKAEKYAEAAAQFEIAYQLVPDNKSLKMALTNAYYKSGNRTKAISMLEQVVGAEPDNHGTGLLLVNIYLEDNQLDKGRALLARIPESAVTDPFVYTNVGILFLNKEQPADARTYFGKAIALNAAAAENYYYRGLASVQLKDNAAAKADFEKVIALAPDSSEAAESKELLKGLK
jgi:Flp pilus assembly protein TadD